MGGEAENDHQDARAQSHQNQERQEQAAPGADSRVAGVGENDPSLRIAGRHLVEVLHDLPAVGTTAEMSFDQGGL
jgi:hypothetical protein